MISFLAFDDPKTAARRGIAPGAALALCAGLALAACGSSGGGGSSGSGSTSQSLFYLSGPSGQDRGSGPALVSLNPSAASVPGSVSTVVGEGAWSAEAAIAQWSPSGGNASGIGIRYRVYAGAAQTLQRLDLLASSGAPAPAQLSSASTASFCPAGNLTALNDYATPSNSLLVFRQPNGSTCGTAADPFTLVPLSAGPSAAPLAAGTLVEPVDAIRDATGAIIAFLVVNHTSTGNIDVATVGVAASAAAIGSNTPFATLQGYGATYSGGDFQTLAVVALGNSRYVWLWKDVSTIYAAQFTAGAGGITASAAVAVYTTEDTDTILAPGIVDAAVAGSVYVAMSDTTNVTNRIVHIDTTAISFSGANGYAGNDVLDENEPSGSHVGVRIVGLAGANLIYTYSDQSALKSVPKSASTPATAGTTIWAQPASNPTAQALDPGFAPVIVGGGVYFCVVPGTPSQASDLPQAWFYGGSGAPTVLGSHGSQVLGGAVAAPASTANPAAPAYASAIVATFSGAASAAVSGVSAGDAYTGATIYSYDGAGNATALGAVATLTNDQYQSAALSEGPLQAGMPALLEVGGYSTGSGWPSTDLYVLTPGAAGSLVRATTNMQ